MICSADELKELESDLYKFFKGAGAEQLKSFAETLGGDKELFIVMTFLLSGIFSKNREEIAESFGISLATAEEYGRIAVVEYLMALSD